MGIQPCYGGVGKTVPFCHYVRDEFEAAAHGTDLACATRDLDNWLRGQIKYADRNELQDARDKLWEFIDDHGCGHVIEVW